MNDRCIVFSPRRSFIRPWIRAYFASGNTIPLVIIPGPKEDWGIGDMDYCRATVEFCGGSILNCSKEWERGKSLSDRAVRDNIGWYTKKLILHAVASRISPKSWAWIDDDVEITGDLSECFDYAETRPGFIVQQFYYATGHDHAHPDRLYRSKIDKDYKIGWNSMIFFHGDANERLRALDRDFPIEDDENIFAYLYKTDLQWHDGFWDCSEKKWQYICKSRKDIPVGWRGKLIHYTDLHNNAEIKRYWADRANDIPMAPFEPEVPVAGKYLDPVDAVFVIGSGSNHNDMELRYALRSLDRNCRFIRDVYICGRCPDWINKSKVKFLPWPDRFSHAKDANIIDKLRHACEQVGIARRILFCSDDQFVTRPCTWEDFKPRYQKQYSPDDNWYTERHHVWHDRLRSTLERERVRRSELGLDCNSIFYYEPHIWMPIDRDKFIEYAKWSKYETREDAIVASGYYNFVIASGVPNFDHIFIGGGDHGDLLGITHISYNDNGFDAAIYGANRIFPDACVMEKDCAEGVSQVAMHIRTSPPMIDYDISQYDSRPATPSERRDIQQLMYLFRNSDIWQYFRDDVFNAEKMRLSCAYGWRIVWLDIKDRVYSINNNRGSGAYIPSQSDEAKKVTNRYLEDSNGVSIPIIMPGIHISDIRSDDITKYIRMEWGIG